MSEAPSQCSQLVVERSQDQIVIITSYRLNYKTSPRTVQYLMWADDNGGTKVNVKSLNMEEAPLTSRVKSVMLIYIEF